MAAPWVPPVVDLSPADEEAERTTYGGLADSVRRLADASLRTTLPADEVDRIRAELDRLTERLASEAVEGSLGVSVTPDGRLRDPGNAVVGLRNPVAPPLTVVQDRERGRARADFHLNGLYEGPSHAVHGGVIALVLDQVAGEAAAAGGKPGMTGTLRIRYERRTPLGDCSAEAWVSRVEGVKTYVEGELRRADGERTATCEAVFILPRQVREALDRGDVAPERFE